MTRTILTLVFSLLLSSVGLFAHEYEVGDVIEKNGITYKVLVSYWVTDSKESPDTVKGPNQFYSAGELMAIKVSKEQRDVVIPAAVGRYKVIGLTDSLFYGHEHGKIWLPELMFVGNGCFAKLKVDNALVVHNIGALGYAVFDELDGDLIFDVTRSIDLGNSFRKMQSDSSYAPCAPKGLVKFNTKMLSHAKTNPTVYASCYTASSKNYKAWLDKAFEEDSEFQKNELMDKNLMHCKRTYSTTPRLVKKGLTITSSAVAVKKMGFPWGTLTQDYYRQAKYSVVNKKKRKTVVYNDFSPVADAAQKAGWYVKFVGDQGEVKYMLNGKKIKK